jgi:hypothetical protein
VVAAHEQIQQDLPQIPGTDYTVGAVIHLTESSVDWTFANDAINPTATVKLLTFYGDDNNHIEVQADLVNDELDFIVTIGGAVVDTLVITDMMLQRGDTLQLAVSFLKIGGTHTITAYATNGARASGIQAVDTYATGYITTDITAVRFGDYDFSNVAEVACSQVAVNIGTAESTTAGFSAFLNARTEDSIVGTTLITYNPAQGALDDAYVQELNPDTNYGTATAFLLASGGTNWKWIFLRWNLDTAGVPAGATITSCILRLDCLASTGQTGRDYLIDRNLKAWVEGEITYNTAATAVAWEGANCEDAANYDSTYQVIGTIPIAVGTHFTPDMKDLAQDALDNRSNILDIRIRQSGGNAAGQWSFTSNDAGGAAATRPTLLIKYYTYGDGGVRKRGRVRFR